MHLAADGGHSEIVSLLLAGGANTEATDKVRREIRSDAFPRGRPKMAEFVIGPIKGMCLFVSEYVGIYVLRVKGS